MVTHKKHTSEMQSINFLNLTGVNILIMIDLAYWLYQFTRNTNNTQF